MEHNAAVRSIELIAIALQILGVAVIALALFYATVRSVLHFRQRKPDAYDRLRIFIGKALQLGLDFLVAADIIGTVTVAPTREGIVTLGLLIAVRTFLIWSISVEIEGCWPWQVARNREG